MFFCVFAVILGFFCGLLSGLFSKERDKTRYGIASLEGVENPRGTGERETMIRKYCMKKIFNKNSHVRKTNYLLVSAFPIKISDFFLKKKLTIIMENRIKTS